MKRGPGLLTRPALRARISLFHDPDAHYHESSTAHWSGDPIVTCNVLILGASYGSLFATKLLMAGHRATLVCTRPTAELINREGSIVRFPIKGHDTLVDVASKALPGSLTA